MHLAGTLSIILQLMLSKALLVWILLPATCIAAGDDVSLFDGDWVVSWQSRAGANVSAELHLKSGEGTWRYRVLTAERENNCIKQLIPVHLETTRSERHVLIVDRADALQGCGISRMKLEVTPEGRVTGHWGKRAEVIVWSKQ